MAEYIDREKLKTQLTLESSLGHIKTLEDVERIVDFVSTADVAPVKHGEWRHIGGDEWCCSCCSFVITTEGSWEVPTKKYCEECGAKMDL